MRSFTLTDKQIDRISEFLANMAVVVAASTIIPSFLIAFELRDIILGAIGTMTLLYLSIKIIKQ